MKHSKKESHKLIQTNEISSTTEKNMKTRILSGLILLLICLPCAFVGSWLFFVFILILACFSIYELIKVPKQKKISILIWIALYSMTLLYIYWGFIKNSVYWFTNHEIPFNSFTLFAYGFSSDYRGTLLVSTVLIGICFAVLFLATISDETFTIKDVFYYFGMSILVGLGFQCFYYIRYLPFFIDKEFMYDNGINQYLGSSLLFMYVVIGTMITDIGAYFVGVLFGKHKMNPRISPKKTREGFFGGIVISFLVSISYVFILDACGCRILPGIIDIEHWYWVLLISFVMPIIGNLGDLAFSAIKRDYNIKDYGSIIPGHGGILDRIDSLLFSMIAVAIILMLIVNGWNVLI